MSKEKGLLKKIFPEIFGDSKMLYIFVGKILTPNKKEGDGKNHRNLD